MPVLARLSFFTFLLLCSASVSASTTWRYDMLLNSKIIGVQTLKLVPTADGSLLIQTTSVEKDGWFSSFKMNGITAEQLDEDARSVAMETRVTANGRTWWSQLFADGNGLRGTGRDMGELSETMQQNLAALDKQLNNEVPPTLEELKSQIEAILANNDGELQAELNPDKKFVTSLNALPYYLKHTGRIPGALQLLDNEGLQVINSPIVDLGTQQMEIGGEHYTAHHIKVEKADAGTHIWFNADNTGPVVLMIAGKSGKKKFQISLQEVQSATN